MHTITKARLREALGFDTDAQVAEFFDISPSAVSLWKEDGPIPELRQLQALRRRPDLFALPVEQGAPRTTADGVV